jgi:MoxR-like ATPase
LIRSFEGEADGVSTDSVVDALLAHVPERPRSVDAELEAAKGARS